MGPDLAPTADRRYFTRFFRSFPGTSDTMFSAASCCGAGIPVQSLHGDGAIDSEEVLRPSELQRSGTVFF